MLRRLLTAILFFLSAPLGAAAVSPDIILITLDTARADRMGFLGSKRGLTPRLDAVARDGVVFLRAYAQAPLTTVSHATLFTGTYPQFHGVNDFGVPLPADLPALAELLRGRGYRTAAFVGSIILDPRNGLAPGFDRGFDVYDAGFRLRRGREDRYQTMERRAEEVVGRAVAWLEQNPARPFFLWVHLFDPHDPYEPPAPYAQKFGAAPYDGEIAYTDAAVGKLLAALRARQLYDGAFLAILADHGEGLGDHGENTHGVFLYDETIRVPLLLKLPRGQSAGRRVRTPVGLVDVAPTVLDVAGLPSLQAMQGRSLLPLLSPQPPAGRPVYSVTDYPRRAFGWSDLASWRAGSYLLVRAPEREFYDLETDPRASRNLAPSRAAEAGQLAAEMEEFRRRSARSPQSSPVAGLDPREVEKLTALGYVGGAFRPLPVGPPSGLDPKQKIHLANALHDAILAIESDRAAQAVPLLQQVLAENPQMYIAQYQLGVALSRQGNYRAAIAPLQHAIALLPDAAMAHYELGFALFATGDGKTAAVHFELAVGRMPKFADAHFSLAAVYARIDRVPEAVAELQTTLGLNPKHARAHLLLGRIFTLQGQPEAALPHLLQATLLEPTSSEAYAFLADAYERLGQSAEAGRARAQAELLKSRRAP